MSAPVVWRHPPTGPPTNNNIPCLTSFSTFNEKIYYGTIPIAQADPASFVYLSSNNCVTYAKDQYRVYIGNMGVAYMIVPSADPNSFTPFFDTDGLILYSEDNKNVYATEDIAYGTTPLNADINKLTGADRSSFSPLYDNDGYFTGYAKDVGHVYYLLNSIPLADPSSFVVLRGIHNYLYSGVSGYFDSGFGKDNRNIYYGADRIEGADPLTFSPIDTQSGFWTPYSKDKNSIYCEKTDASNSIEILSANPNSFSPETDASGAFTGYANDKNHRWNSCTLLY